MLAGSSRPREAVFQLGALLAWIYAGVEPFDRASEMAHVEQVLAGRASVGGGAVLARRVVPRPSGVARGDVGRQRPARAATIAAVRLALPMTPDPPAPGIAPSSRPHARDRVAAQIPPGYRPRMHLAGLILFCLAAIVAALAALRAPRACEWLVVPAAFVLANAVEWLVHRGPLHHPWPPRVLYQRHTLTHHAAFGADSMAVRELRELRFVLFPLYAMPLFALLVLPVALGLGAAVSRNAALLFYATAIAYYLLYELMHLSHHLPAAHPLTRARWLRALRRHHQRHHEPAAMTRGNFNVSFPLCDWLAGTRL